jgi:hypothetical protein
MRVGRQGQTVSAPQGPRQSPPSHGSPSCFSGAPTPSPTDGSRMNQLGVAAAMTGVSPRREWKSVSKFRL